MTTAHTDNKKGAVGAFEIFHVPPMTTAQWRTRVTGGTDGRFLKFVRKIKGIIENCDLVPLVGIGLCLGFVLVMAVRQGVG